MAADCSDSLAAHIVCCAPHNGLTHGESRLSLSTVYLLASSSLDFCLTPLSSVVWRRQRSLLMIVHFSCIVPFFFLSVGISSSPLLSFPTRFLIIANARAAFQTEYGLDCSPDVLPDHAVYLNLEPAANTRLHLAKNQAD